MNSLDPNEILDILPGEYCLIDLKSREIIQSNHSDFQPGTKCYRALFNREEPCRIGNQLCPCQNLKKGTVKESFVTEKIEVEDKRIYKVTGSLVKEDLALLHLNDISEYVSFKEEVKQNSKRFERIEKLARFGYWELNTRTRKVFPSYGIREIYGIDDAAISLEEASRFVHKDDIEVFNSNIQQLINDGRSFDLTCRIIRPQDEKIRHIRIFAESKKERSMAYGIVLDITESVKATRIMKEHEQYLDSLFRNMNSAFAQFRIIYDKKKKPKDLVIIDVNARFEDYFKVKKEAVLNQSYKVIVPGFEEYWLKRFRKMVLSGQPEAFFEYSDNLGRYFEISAFTPQEGFFALILTEVTQKKKAEIALKEAKENAVESDRLKTLFLANMSHEIRTPLNGILGFSSLLADEDVEDEHRKLYGKIIENSSQRLMTVIDDILDISMIESNQLKIEYSDFDMNDMLEELQVFYQNHYRDKLEKIDFKLRQCDRAKNLVVYSDKDRIYQLYKNLLDNAFKFTSEGSIEFGIKNVDDISMELFVKDTGIGIRETKHDVIFQSFRQAEEGQERKYEGSGLGLAIVAGITEKLNGQVEVKSKPGKGTEFKISIPHNRNQSKVLNRIHLQLSDSLSKHLKEKTIVSFEDDNLSVEFLKTVVESMGYKLVNFTYAEEGIEFLEQNQADMIFMDVQLPQMNGYEATKIIKSGHPEVPIVMQTAFAMSMDKDKAYNAGCDDYIAKPLTIDSLKNKIDKYLKIDS